MKEFLEFLIIGWPIVAWPLLIILIYWLQLYIIRNAVSITETKTNSQKNLFFSFRALKDMFFFDAFLVANAFAISWCLLSPFLKDFIFYHIFQDFILGLLLWCLIISISSLLFKKLKEYSKGLFRGIITFVALAGIIVFIVFFYFNSSLANSPRYFVLATLAALFGITSLEIALHYLPSFIKKKRNE